uniref:NADH dehydrogenase [ubiquinone] 1 alpha subcomplex subunit 2 n=1 Tax=Gallus gallus TaxID=9031 RepID=A0A8V0YC52_CHICK
MAAAVVRGIGGGLGRSLRELRVHLCQRSAGSRGAREFIEQHYVTLKQANPDFPILIRECSGVQPRLWARYEFGKEKSVSLHNLSVDEVAKALENIVKGKIRRAGYIIWEKVDDAADGELNTEASCGCRAMSSSARTRSWSSGVLWCCSRVWCPPCLTKSTATCVR